MEVIDCANPWLMPTQPMFLKRTIQLRNICHPAIGMQCTDLILHWLRSVNSLTQQVMSGQNILPLVNRKHLCICRTVSWNTDQTFDTVSFIPCQWRSLLVLCQTIAEGRVFIGVLIIGNFFHLISSYILYKIYFNLDCYMITWWNTKSFSDSIIWLFTNQYQCN